MAGIYHNLNDLCLYFYTFLHRDNSKLNHLPFSFSSRCLPKSELSFLKADQSLNGQDRTYRHLKHHLALYHLLKTEGRLVEERNDVTIYS